MVNPAPNEHPFSPRSPRGLFFAWGLSQAKKEASPSSRLASSFYPSARAATARAAALTVSATMTTAATTGRHEHPAARQGRQQRDNHCRLGYITQLHDHTLLLDEIDFSLGMTVQTQVRHGYRVTCW
jgi:hypothetical protein